MNQERNLSEDPMLSKYSRSSLVDITLGPRKTYNMITLTGWLANC